ncbi:hypothetical protein HPB47_012675, partial [Ixodes persulcatus]
MHPVHHAQRREARARAIHKCNGCKPSTAYTDAASYPGRAATTATVIMNNEPRSSISLPRNHPLQAEEAAIALALTQTEAEVIVTDSQQAYRNFASGRIHAYTLRLINQNPPTRQVRIVWAPAHQGIPGNEIANLVARDLTRRADAEEAEPERMHPLVSYLEIRQHYRLTRKFDERPPQIPPSAINRILGGMFQKLNGSNEMLFEEALQLVGDFGVFQYLLIVYLCVFVAPLRVLPLFAHIFSLLEPPHWCHNPFLEGFNFTRDEIRNMSIPKTADGAWSKCTMYNLNWTDVALSLSPGEPGLGQPQDSWPTVPCEYGWEYDHSVIYPTIVSEMDWVCGSTWKSYVSNSVFFGCMSFGVITFGAISDKVGRVPVMVLVYVLAGAGAVVTYFTNNFAVFVVTRAIEGAVLLSISIIPFVLAVEYVPAQKRMLVLSAFRFAYPLLGVCMPWVAYAVGHWRLLNAVVIVPCILGPLVS